MPLMILKIQEEELVNFVDGCPGTFHVIDGQHRLFGYLSVDDKAGGLRIVIEYVTVFDGLSVSQEADIFIEVNEKANLLLQI